MIENITQKKQDQMRERLFKSAYGITATIFATTFLDEDWNWNKCILNFRDSLGKQYGLIEHFQKGDDNSTDYVELEYTNKDGEFQVEKFNRFIDAELQMVDLMKRRLNGED